MANTEVQLSEHQPMLTSSAEEGANTNPVVSATAPAETSTTVVRK